MPSSAVPSFSNADSRTPEVQIRVVESFADLSRCVDLQREIWGAEYDEIVPASLMRVAGHIGALTIGAYAPDGELVGFAFGLTGVNGGERVHWSHMLGVTTDVRDRGVGQRLKEYQRAELARRGVQRILWTFDPLQARNAHLNLNRLGARVVEYVEDMYGASQSPLHQAGTDRLIVEWWTDEGNDKDGGPVVSEGAPILTPSPQEGDKRLQREAPPLVLIEIPWDLQDVIAKSAERVQEWRVATRASLQWALRCGYRVAGLHRTAARRAFYVVERAEASGRANLSDRSQV